jgi:hypothetical protein
MGNCGAGIAPCRPEAREVAMRDLVNVEAIPFDVLNMGITWDWETFPEPPRRRKRRCSRAWTCSSTSAISSVVGGGSA